MEVKNQIRAVLHGRETKSFDRLIVNYDGDKGGDGPDYLSRIHQSIGDLLRVQEVAAEACGAGHWRLDDGARELRAVVWHVPTTSAPGVPAQQCLERVICAAVAEVWPDRMASVAEWLAQRPDPTSGLHREGTIPKAYTWTLMGGWFAEHGCDDFFRDIWRSEELAQALERQLGPEVWGHLKACAGPV